MRHTLIAIAALSGGLLLGAFGRELSRPARAQPVPPALFDYKSVDLVRAGVHDEAALDQVLNHFGLQGWRFAGDAVHGGFLVFERTRPALPPQRPLAPAQKQL